ncbi:hypothetical protein H4582DRAFT_1902064 [Lactarius indigo]|nr:hypothetical protein H4582DRAFT_1902064 [Lactarius indigo]
MSTSCSQRWIGFWEGHVLLGWVLFGMQGFSVESRNQARYFRLSRVASQWRIQGQDRAEAACGSLATQALALGLFLDPYHYPQLTRASPSASHILF